MTFLLIHGARSGLVAPVLAAAVVVCVSAVAVPLLGVAVSSGEGLRFWRRRRGDHPTAAAESRAQAMMSELCPHGWRAQVTVQGDPDRRRVAIDWAELSADGGEPVVSRRVWGSTLSEALDAMVSDRRMDETLERIEQGAVARGARWPDR